MRKSSKYALRIVDINRWGSPVTEQYGIHSLPYYRLFDPSGKEIDRGFKNVYQKVVDPSVDPAKPSGSGGATTRRAIAIGMALLGFAMLRGD